MTVSREYSVMYLGIQSSLELQHVGILLGVDVVIREDDRQTVHCQSRGRGSTLWRRETPVRLTSCCFLESST